MSKIVGTIKAVTGTVKVMEANGTAKIVKAGDAVRESDIIDTLMGSSATIVFEGGKELDLGENAHAVIDESVFGAESFEEGDVAAEVEALQAALLAGEDLGETAEETAAGEEDTGGLSDADYLARTDDRGGVDVQFTPFASGGTTTDATTGAGDEVLLPETGATADAFNGDGIVDSNELTITVTAVDVIEEEVTAGDVIATFSAFDLQNDPLVYALQNDPNGYFTLNGNSVLLTQAGVDAINNDILKLGSLDITVAASDGTYIAADTDTSNITRVNDNAPTITVSALDVTEEAVTAGDVIATFSASDLDGDTLTYALQNDPNGYFVLNGSNVELTQAGVDAINDDKLNLNTLDITVEANDGVHTVSDTDTSNITRVDDVGTGNVYVDDITEDDVINAAEAAGTVIVTGSVDGEFSEGATISFSVNGTDYSATVTADLTWSAEVAGSDLENDLSFDVTATGLDDAGNPISATVTSTHTVDLTADNDGDEFTVTIDGITEDTGSDTTDFITNDKNILIRGTVDLGDNNILSVEFDGTIYTTQDEELSVDDNGNWTLDVRGTELDDGTYTITATVTDVAGNSDTATQNVVVDTTIGTDTDPQTPAVTIDSITDDTGASSSDFITNDNTLVIAGTVELAAGDTLSVNFNGTDYTTANGLVIDNGNWTLDVRGTELDDGTYTITATVTDVAGNSDTATQNVVVDTTIGTDTDPQTPAVTIDSITDDTGASSSDFITNDNTLVIAGTVELAAGDTLSVNFNGTDYTTANGLVIDNGNWTLDVRGTELDDGTYTITATVTDVAGNSDTATQNVVVDTTIGLVDQTISYWENQAVGALLGTVATTDGEPVTGFSFKHSDGTISSLSEDGYYSIDTSGNVTITAEGVASAVNDYETAPNSGGYTVIASDVAGNSSEVILTLSELNINEAPVGVEDSAAALEGALFSETTSVLNNDTDPENAQLHVLLFASDASGSDAVSANGVNSITTALGGTVIMNSDGTYTYSAPVLDHSASDSIEDSFVYKASDGVNASEWTTVAIDVLDSSPSSVDDFATVMTGEAVSGNVLDNDELGEDAPAVLVSVEYDGVVYTEVDANGDFGKTVDGVFEYITTDKGILTINQNGNYTYESTLDTSHGGTDGLNSWENIDMMIFNGARTVESENEFFIDELTKVPLDNILTLTHSGTVSVVNDIYADGTDGIGVAGGAGSAKYINGHATSPEAIAFDLGHETTSMDVDFYSGTNSGSPFYWATFDASGAFMEMGSEPVSQPFSLHVENSDGSPFHYVAFYGADDSAGTKVLMTGISNIDYDISGDDVFTYVVQDADGDTSDAVLHIGTEEVSPALVAVDDSDPSAVASMVMRCLPATAYEALAGGGQDYSHRPPYTATEGSDTFSYKNIHHTGTISMLGGDDIVSTSESIYNTSIYMGEGDDTTIVGATFHDARLYGEAGNDTLSVKGDMRNVAIDMGTGDDKIIFEGASASGNMLGSLSIDMGEGNDSLAIATDAGNIGITMGADNDRVCLGGDFQGRMELGSGSDGVRIAGNAHNMTINTDTGISIDPVTAAMLALAAEGELVAVTGTVTSASRAGDVITMTVNGNEYSGTVNVDNTTWSIDIAGADLISDRTFEATLTRANGSTATTVSGQSYNDIVSIAGDVSSTNNGTINTGAGADYIEVGSDINNANIITESGDDYLNVGGTLNGYINTGAGNDFVGVGGDLTKRLDTGSGDDYVKVAGNIGNWANIDMGEGNDYLGTAGNVLNANISMGGGNDYLDIDGTLQSANVNTGEGNDYLEIGALLTSVKINMGDGMDVLRIDAPSTDFQVVNNANEIIDPPAKYILMKDVNGNYTVLTDVVLASNATSQWIGSADWTHSGRIENVETIIFSDGVVVGDTALVSNTVLLPDEPLPPLLGTETSGNVITNDMGIGLLSVVSVTLSDGTVVDLPQDGSDASIALDYGMLDINSTGAYTYTADDANPDVQALELGDTITEEITYTLSNGTSIDTATISLTIQCFGSDQDNTLVYDITAATNDLGSGFDTLVIEETVLDFGNVDNISNIERIDLTGQDDQELTLSFDDVVKVTDGNNILEILGNSTDSVTLQNSADHQWVKTGTGVVENGFTFDVYTSDAVTVKIEQSIIDSIQS